MSANEQRSYTVVETLAYMFSTLGTNIWAQIGRGKSGLVPLTAGRGFLKFAMIYMQMHFPCTHYHKESANG